MSFKKNLSGIMNLKSIVFLMVCFVSFTWASYLDQGNVAYKKGDFKQAYFLYKKAWQRKENPTISQFNMANCLFQLKQTGRALKIYRTIIDEYPDFLRAYFNAGGVYFQLDEIGEALLLYEKAHEVAPKHLGVIKMIGECHLKLKQRANALEFFELGHTLEPEKTSWIYAMAEVYLSLEDYISVEALLLEALEHSQGQAELLAYLGDIEMVMEKPEVALLQYNKSLQIDPTQGFLYQKVGQLQEEQGQKYLALMTYKRGMQNKAIEKDYLLETGRIFIESADIASALDEFVKAEKAGVLGAKDYILDLFQQLQNQNNKELADKLAPIVLELYPRDPEVKDFVVWKKIK